MVVRPFDPTLVTIGVINPVGVATAIDTSAFFHLGREQVNRMILKQTEYVLPDVFAHPRSICFGDVGKRQSDCLDNEVIHTQLSTLVLLSKRLVENFPKLDNFTHINANGEVVVWSIAFSFSETRTDRTPHIRQRGVSEFRSRSDRLRSGRANALRGRFKLFDIFADNPSVGTGTLDLGKRNTTFKSDLLGNRGGEDDVSSLKFGLGRSGGGLGLFLRYFFRFWRLFFGFFWLVLRLRGLGGKGMSTREVVTLLADDSNGESDRYALGPIGRLRESMRRVLVCTGEYLR
jgi:hypothetical protein